GGEVDASSAHHFGDASAAGTELENAVRGAVQDDPESRSRRDHEERRIPEQVFAFESYSREVSGEENDKIDGGDDRDDSEQVEKYEPAGAFAGAVLRFEEIHGRIVDFGLRILECGIANRGFGILTVSVT